MTVNFAKAVASGNDFVIVDNREKKVENAVKEMADLARTLCMRRHAIGADGLLLLEDSKSADFKMRIFNPDGSEVSMCGNGIRCSALYAHAKKWCGPSMKVETQAGLLDAEVALQSVRIRMTPPKDINVDRNIGLGNTIMNIHTVHTGVPHAVHFVRNLKDYPVEQMGAKIRYHKMFEPGGTNADFVETVNESTISVRTYERGVEEETLACGTGAVASAILSHLVNGTQQPVSVVTRGTEVLKVYFRKELNTFAEVRLEGKAKIVFEGRIDYV
jgi:diaminopimelate epimerase